MKKILTALMLVLAISLAGCKEKKVYNQADIAGQDVLQPGSDVDWIGLYLRAHELDSIKKVAEVQSLRAGYPMEPLPDSVSTLWDNMLNEILLRHGDIAFDKMYDNHRDDIERYLRLDFIHYGFITKVYLPYKATVSTKEKYGEICIGTLERELAKAQSTIMYTQQVPSHYGSLLEDLFYAYVNYEKNDKALALSDDLLAFLASGYGQVSAEYAKVLAEKATLCHATGSDYSAVVTARQAIALYDRLLAAPAADEAAAAELKAQKEKLAEKISLWQAK